MTITAQTNTTLPQIASVMQSRDNFVICGHVNPDGDCLGSQLALCLALKKLGKQARCIFAKNQTNADSFQFLPEYDLICDPSLHCIPVDTFIAVDVPNKERMSDAAVLFNAAKLRITIDHHAVDERISEYNYVDPDAAATAVLVWELIGLLGITPDEQIANCAYTGLMTDTGRFQFQNVDARALLAASQMVEAGARPAKISAAIYQNRSLASLKLTSKMVDHIVIHAACGFAISWVSQNDMQDCGAVRLDAETLIDTLRSITGIRVACVLREDNEFVRASLRAKDDTDVACIARMFGGGGHVAAAGCTIHEPLQVAIEKMTQTLETELG